MVGYNDSRQKEYASSHAIAGAVSGAVTRFLCQPLDVIKIRFQFLTFELLTRQAWQLALLQSDEVRPVLHFACGAVAGSVATVASFPADVARTRLVAQGEPRMYRGVVDTFVTLYKTEGSRAYFKGLSPSLIQVAPHTGAQFAFYSSFSSLWLKYGKRGEVSVVGSLLCGSAAGLCAKTVVYPLDLSKKRLQVQGFEVARKHFGKVFRCEGLLDCMRRVVQEEGLAGLFKGLWPSAIKAATTTALHFCIYEQVCRLLAAAHARGPSS